ncbi:MAG TPA: kelch repeat-containing protein [Candidatus Polarisedimenticolaceae bacterium]|nr:kelch repeat-containing protein [Candidatus Polarisedimenticolaceae bacterium]
MINLIAAVWLMAASSTGDGASPDRVGDLAAIERLRFERRTWPGAKDATRPPFEVAVPEGVIRRRVERTLTESALLLERYGHGISKDDLRSELERMIRGSKDPAVLRAMFRALGDDPRRIAETIARPVVADRMLRDAFASDATIHAPLRDLAAAAVSHARGAGEACPAGAQCVDLVVRADQSDWNAFVKDLSHRRFQWPGMSRRPALLDLAEATKALASIPVGPWSDVTDGGSRYLAWRVTAKDARALHLAVAVWKKRSFDEWLDRESAGRGVADIAPLDPGALPDLSPDSTCTPDTWSLMDPEFPASRTGHTMVWDGSEVIVWGGLGVALFDDGWKYSPATDTWTPISRVGAPSPRAWHVAVWSGTEMIVWGGINYTDSTSGPGSGGRYNPVTDSWVATSLTGAPGFRQQAAAVWSGTEMIVWGGSDDSGQYLGDGARYRPATDSWVAVSATGAPTPRAIHVAVWTGSEMAVWGGFGLDDQANTTALSSGARYKPSTDSWSAMASSGAPAGRYYFTGVWSGTELIVWGGVDANGVDLGDGARYKTQNNHWSTMASAGAPVARDNHVAVWTGSRMVLWGGYGPAGSTATGSRYDPAADSWQAMTTSGAPSNSASTAVWTGTRMITFGGSGPLGLSHNGGRYDPVGDTWLPVRSTWRPAPRSRQATIWTGSEMIVWGGYTNAFPEQLDAGRYEPATDTWTALSMAGAPTDRWDPSAVWTGSRMVVWGGGEFDPAVGSERPTNGGGRYDPAGDSWSPMSTVGQPLPREWHTTVWTGTDMIVWGGITTGSQNLGDGGRYHPASDLWFPMSASGAPSARAYHVAAWTGREMVIAGGNTASALDFGGARYDPDRDLWTGNRDTGALRLNNGAASWSGRALIHAFGDVNGLRVTGDRYDPYQDTWSGLPDSDTWLQVRQGVAVCGGIAFWGDDNAWPNPTGDGRIFDDTANSWSAMNTSGAPLGCVQSGAVSDGTRLIVFGGEGPGGGQSGLSDSGGVYCGCSAPPPLRLPILFVDHTATGDRVSWYLLPEATSYDVVRGDLGILRSSGGNFAAATTACLANDTPVSTSFDPTVPAVGQGFWYLARSGRPGEASTFDSGAPRQVASRDAGIAASGASCP